MSNVDINVDGRTDGLTENRTPVSHPATSRCDKKQIFTISMHMAFGENTLVFTSYRLEMICLIWA